MGRVRSPRESNKYYIPRSYYITAVKYALQYKDWIGELKAGYDTRQGIRYDKEKVQTSGSYDSTSETAIKLMTISDKVKMIDKIIEEVAPGLESYLRLSVCYGFSYYGLVEKGIPINRNEYSVIRQHFYYELSRRI